MLRAFPVVSRLPIPSPASTQTTSVLSRMSSTAPSPKFPKFVPVEESTIHSISKPDGIRFSLVSYNILAQVYVKSSLFPHSPSPCLRWKARSQAILSVLKNLGADFLCLQEVDEYNSFYKGNMESNGYYSSYIQRSGQKRDGCGIFYKHDMAELLLEEKIEYNDLVDSILDGNGHGDDKPNNKEAVENKDDGPKIGSTLQSALDQGDPDDPRVRLKRDCVGIMAVFKLKNPSNHVVIVANTHLYWDPDWADVKLAQAKYLLSRLAQFKTLVSQRFDCSPSLILSGDFNSTPGDKILRVSVIYQCGNIGGLSK
ncbi:carbon catabolite repressor protein 4 homolog 4 isoform X2 [Prunus dulcis]|uniref:carbon catabolite repressor protein 4 homolog 4 isoform X2 n=1 Tax=Prunus dulcis TaxID=3755 RepID=UPI00148200FA|nr:carbon catabolite repressor protein 4 homolog 4 isoform X2 [Prunus dulcis]